MSIPEGGGGIDQAVIMNQQGRNLFLKSIMNLFAYNKLVVSSYGKGVPTKELDSSLLLSVMNKSCSIVTFFQVRALTRIW